MRRYVAYYNPVCYDNLLQDIETKLYSWAVGPYRFLLD